MFLLESLLNKLSPSTMHSEVKAAPVESVQSRAASPHSSISLAAAGAGAKTGVAAFSSSPLEPQRFNPVEEAATPCQLIAEQIAVKAKQLHSPCCVVQLSNAQSIMEIHNNIERIAYQAFVEQIRTLKITGDAITEEQSGLILAHIKKQAHVEMYKKGGYIDNRGKLLTPSQIERLILSVGRIVHDRDTKLTDARYHTLSDLLLGLDDHNAMVKAILIKSWFRCELTVPEHLDQVKSSIQFYEQLNTILPFDLKKAVEQKVKFWDRYFPTLREVPIDCKAQDNSAQFVRILEVRNYFEGESVSFDSETKILKFNQIKQDKIPFQIIISDASLNRPIKDLFNFDEKTFTDLFAERVVKNQVRKSNQRADILIQNPIISLKQFLKEFFPEVAEQIHLVLIRS